ncbi:hypothetical protein SBA4_3190003 [Candidatus Sulfopaludibacter sp. SbA4]|nr:hypothetical protein SBA4_3190003 [Candidatus Sulfopaludibacter sp. SbA4]
MLHQAQTWAVQISSTRPGTKPAVVELVIDRNALATLDTLVFSRGDFYADDFWSFVHHCRSGGTDHRRTPGGFYDVVYGPVAAFWNQRMIIADSDQISFHTPSAETILNNGSRSHVTM